MICDNLSLAPCADLKTFRVNAQVVATTFRNTFPDVNVLEFLPIICDTIYVVLHDDVDIEAVLDTLPGHIAGLRTLYIHEKFLEKPSTQEARRAILPNRSNGQVDNTEYEILRPGVMLSSPVDDAHVNAFTSGVLIRNGSGDKFMTAPTHAMGSMLNVYSGEGHNPIGQNHSLIPGTDITLVQLASARAFENVTLERPSQDGLGTISTTLRSLIGEYGRPAPTTSRGGFFFDTPYTGTMKAGLFIMRSFTTSDEMMIHNWYYMGQQPSRPYETRIPNGVCGASIFDADGNVWGFFASFIEKGPFSAMCTSLPAEELSTHII
ncbi:hypothetical protein MN608_04516 [Microdochium nivale]|nr:hypothetical protein MN608_04516 [Microdochium nivale]